MAERLAAARANEASLNDAAIDDLRWRQFYAAAGAGGVLLFAVLLLAPVPEREVDVLTAMRALTVTPAAGPPCGHAPKRGRGHPRVRTIEFDDLPGLESVRAVTGHFPEPSVSSAPVAPVAPVACPVAPVAPVAPLAPTHPHLN